MLYLLGQQGAVNKRALLRGFFTFEFLNKR